MKRLIVVMSLLLLALGARGVEAQQRTVSGRVTAAETGQPLSGITVMVQGTRIGTLTNPEGRYTLANVPADATTLVFSSLAYSTVEAPITGSVVNVELQAQAVALEGIVVTALGVERPKAQLGTSVQQLGTEELTQTQTPSVVNALQGKVSGVQITGSGTPGGSSSIVIRGSNSIAGNNQPLFIVDGIAVSNRGRGEDISGAGNLNDDLLIDGFDYGNAISDLNPDDIESLTILKGPNAAAIYGSRAANGAVVITTKKGRAGGVSTDVTLNYTWERPSILPDFQDLYGQGATGQFRFVNGAGGGVNDQSDQSWGPRLDGRLIDQFTGPQQPWVAHPDNVRDFFETGQTFSSTVAFSGGTENSTARLSIGYDKSDGYVPNNSFEKVTALLTGSVAVNDRLNTTGSLQYIRNDAKNRPGTGYYGSIMEQFFWFGRQVDMDALRQYDRGGLVNNGPANREFNWNYNYHNNPYWIQYENPIEDSRDRLIASGNVAYDVADWATATLRGGVDLYRFSVAQNYNQGNLSYADPAYNGAFEFVDQYNNEFNAEALFSANRELSRSLSGTATLGVGHRREFFDNRHVETSGLSVPGIYNVSNAAVAPSMYQQEQRREVNSAFGAASVTYNGWWTVEGTARNDVSSTLPEDNNSYFYPSVSTSLVLSDAIPALQDNGVLSFLKVRGSWAQVGSDADPYQLLTTFIGQADKFNGLPQFYLGNDLANAELKPEITTSTEFGVEVGLLDGRVGLDATYYSEETRDQIFAVDVSPTSGFQKRAINAGLLRNTGFEALLSLVPLQLDNGFRWTSTFNFATNDNEVVELTEGVETIIIGNGIFGDSRIEARKGRPYGAIFGTVFERNEDGKLLTENGLPIPASGFSYLGSIQPDWTGGWRNEFNYGSFSLGALLDIKRGGKLVSYTNAVGEYSGVLESSLRGREVDWNEPGLVVDGIDVNTGQPNTETVTAEQYFQGYFPTIEPYVYDASYVKLREVRLGYDVPTRLLDRFGAENMNIALTGRNLFTWTDVPNIDPEFAYSSNNFQGIEYAIPANARSIGLSIRVTP